MALNKQTWIDPDEKEKTDPQTFFGGLFILACLVLLIGYGIYRFIF